VWFLCASYKPQNPSFDTARSDSGSGVRERAGGPRQAVVKAK